MKNFRTYQLALQFYKKADRIKISNRLLRDQYQRALLSIVLNLAEGSGKGRTNDRRRFYEIAMGSLRETQALLTVLEEKELLNESDIIGAHLYKLIQSPGGS